MTLAVVSLDEADKTRGVGSDTAGGPQGDLVTGSNLLTVVEAPGDDDATPADETATVQTAISQTPAAEAALDPASQKNLPPLHLHRVVVHLPNSPLLKERQPVKRQAAPTLETPTLSTPAPMAKVILQPAQPRTRTPGGAPDQWMRNE